jgi:hypothetical protein
MPEIYCPADIPLAQKPVSNVQSPGAAAPGADALGEAFLQAINQGPDAVNRYLAEQKDDPALSGRVRLAFNAPLGSDHVHATLGYWLKAKGHEIPAGCLVSQL